MGEGAWPDHVRVDGVNEGTANEALRLGAMKLPVTTRVVIRDDW